ncbi:MAG: creatininase family protein [Thermoplasmata archaeon]|nr:creatininase family protein [Thermoplasmata archaeon]MCI4341252.1 creatininase family protein [Thermoplasmata archaeon]
MDQATRRVGELGSRTWESELGRSPLVILPVGALEAHGPHLPLAADQIQAEHTAAELAEREHGLVLPSLAYGVCRGARRFPGTVALSSSALATLTGELVTNAGRMGVRRLLVLSGHAEAPHMAALKEGADGALARGGSLRVMVISDYEFVYELRGTLAPASDGHAGLLETSRVLSMTPELVGPVRPSGTDHRPKHRVGESTPEEWPESVVGDPGAASAELGRKVQEHVLRRLQDALAREMPA